MARPKINKLGYPIWFRIAFICLTVLVPIALVLNEGMRAPDERGGIVFKVTFGVLSGFVIIWTFVKRFLLKNIEAKWLSKQALLEHDYSIDNGNPEKIKRLWYQNELKLVGVQITSIVLYGGLVAVIMAGVKNALLVIEDTLLWIMMCYLIAYSIKAIVVVVNYNADEEEGEKDGDKQEDNPKHKQQ